MNALDDLIAICLHVEKYISQLRERQVKDNFIDYVEDVIQSATENIKYHEDLSKLTAVELIEHAIETTRLITVVNLADAYISLKFGTVKYDKARTDGSRD